MGHEEGLLAGTKLILEKMNIGIGTHNMEKAIKAYLDASGMVLVPRYATEEMLERMDLSYLNPDEAQESFKYILEAAPELFKSNGKG